MVLVVAIVRENTGLHLITEFFGIEFIKACIDFFYKQHIIIYPDWKYSMFRHILRINYGLGAVIFRKVVLHNTLKFLLDNKMIQGGDPIFVCLQYTCICSNLELNIFI